MDVFSPLLLLIPALCADAFAASFVYGAGHVKIPVLSACIINLLSTGILSVSLLFGSLLRPFLSADLPVFLCASLLVLSGASKLNAAPTENMAENANRNKPEILSPSEALFLGAGLSLDNGAAGIGAGLSGSSLLAVILLSVLFGFLSIYMGCSLGKRAGRLAGHDFSKYGGALLILLGLLKLF